MAGTGAASLSWYMAPRMAASSMKSVNVATPAWTVAWNTVLMSGTRLVVVSDSFGWPTGYRSTATVICT